MTRLRHSASLAAAAAAAAAAVGEGGPRAVQGLPTAKFRIDVPLISPSAITRVVNRVRGCRGWQEAVERRRDVTPAGAGVIGPRQDGVRVLLSKKETLGFRAVRCSDSSHGAPCHCASHRRLNLLIAAASARQAARLIASEGFSAIKNAQAQPVFCSAGLITPPQRAS